MSEVFRKLSSSATTALGVTLLVFLVLRLTPGDPVELMLGEDASPASREMLRAQLGLDMPVGKQLVGFMDRLWHGDLGNSLAFERPVTTLLAETFPATLLLAVVVSIFANLIGVPLGVWSAANPSGRYGRGIFLTSLLLAAIPSFWLGPLLIYAFSLHWPWLPIGGFESWSGLVLPTLTVGFALAAYLAQTTRAAVRECLNAEYVRTAFAKGATPNKVLFKHVLPNATAPILTVSMLRFGHLLAGSVIIETIFDWPGTGKLAVDAILQRDYPVVQGTVLVVSLIYVALNTVTDLINAWFARRVS